ncbi:MAG: lytic transglycosylase domain-containing protein [Magnetococcales bacterium]|nr:lytic transglycosylase domain-containing protein [Magnetococcales bacterium]
MPNKTIQIILTGFLLLGIFSPLNQAEAANKERERIMNMVAREAVKMGVPVSLALAMAQTESDFNPKCESHKGARGVMQIMPATSTSEYGIHPDDLWNPRINIRLGLHFMARLLKRYKGRVNLALSYYNGGSRVGDLPNARIIPATRRYVQKVRSLQSRYQGRLLTASR